MKDNLGVLGVFLMMFLIGGVDLIVKYFAFTMFHAFLALVLVEVARCRPVRQFVLDHGWERQAIWFWLGYLPLGAGIGWALIMADLAMRNNLSSILTICLPLVGGGILAAFYYKFYVGEMPQSADWAYFIATTKNMKLERQLVYIEKSAQLQAWWIGLWS